jgi:osmotically-inducible protein OsmY
MKKILSLLASITLIALSLQSCFFIAGAAAGAAAITVVYDHRKLEKILADTQITNRIVDKINSDPHFKESHIEVSCFNRVVLLTGETPEETLRQTAEELAHTVPHVSRVYNQITVKGAVSSLTRASDSWITAKTKTQLLATKGMQSGTIKVVTSNGIVYLMGIVSREQGDIAATIASQIDGVKRVMKIFQYKN